jgi:hypothetical protein
VELNITWFAVPVAGLVDTIEIEPEDTEAGFQVV